MAVTAALIWAHARPIQGVHLAVGVLGFAVAGRMTGSGTLPAAVDLSRASWSTSPVPPTRYGSTC